MIPAPNPLLALLANAETLLADPAPHSPAWRATRDTWVTAFGAVRDAAAAAEENAKLRGCLWRLLDAVRDAAIAGTDFPAEVNEAYDTVAPIFGLPLIAEIEKAEDSGDKTALAALADQGNA